jgi:hypothetical protein
MLYRIIKNNKPVTPRASLHECLHTLHPPHQRFLKEIRESRARRGAAYHVLQLRAHPQDAARHSGDESRNCGSRLDTGGNRGFNGCQSSAAETRVI